VHNGLAFVAGHQHLLWTITPASVSNVSLKEKKWINRGKKLISQIIFD